MIVIVVLIMIGSIVTTGSLFMGHMLGEIGFKDGTIAIGTLTLVATLGGMALGTGFSLLVGQPAWKRRAANATTLAEGKTITVEVGKAEE